jgi:phosphoglycolate phosphatase-like HAD superfamily hydrolase
MKSGDFMKRPVSTKGFLFDFDGTLVDTMEGYADLAGLLISKAYPDISAAHGRELYVRTSGIPFIQQIELIRPGNPENANIVRAFEDQKIEGFFASHVDDAVRRTLEDLRILGHVVGVSSGNDPELINRYIERERMEFDIVMGYDHAAGFEKGKPHFDFFMQKFGLEKKDLTFVGDSLKDADKGYENNIQFIGIRGLFSHEDFAREHPDVITVGNVGDIPSLIGDRE